MVSRVLVIDRGVSAARLLRTLRRLRLHTIVACAPADRPSLHVAAADETVITEGLDTDPARVAPALVALAAAHGADAIHPGCGPLALDAGLAAACETRSLRFLGATAAQLQRLQDPALLRADAEAAGLATVTPSDSQAGRQRLLDVIVFGDGKGRAAAVLEHTSSLLRTSRTGLAECPAPGVDGALRSRLVDAARRLAMQLKLRGAGSVRFLVGMPDDTPRLVSFAARLPVEHAVVEEATGLDLVEVALRLAAGESRALDLLQRRRNAVAFLAGITGVDPEGGSGLPAGVLTDVRLPMGTRVETWVERGTELATSSDPVLAHVIVTADARDAARTKLLRALGVTRLWGAATNLALLRAALEDKALVAGDHGPRVLQGYLPPADTITVVSGGLQSTLQDWPGRTICRDAGIPCAGPMDSYAFRVANELVGNRQGEKRRRTVAIECVQLGPTLRFDCPAVVAVTGAPLQLLLDGQPLPMWTAHAVSAGATLQLGAMEGPGARAYVAVAGGFDVPTYLGDRSTYLPGRIGGQAGRPLRTGDALQIAGEALSVALVGMDDAPAYGDSWSIGVLPGPNAEPAALSAVDLALLLGVDWTVHFQSSRIGVRLTGPALATSRTLPDGDPVPCPSGAVLLGQDGLVIPGPDGPVLIDRPVPLVVAQAELWKLGQLRPGDKLRFRLLDAEQARELAWALEHNIDALAPPPQLPEPEGTPATLAGVGRMSQLLTRSAGAEGTLALDCRTAGEGCLRVAYQGGSDLAVAARIELLRTALRGALLPGLLEASGGLRVLQLQFDPARLTHDALLRAVERAEQELDQRATAVVTTRILHLPLCPDDPQLLEALQRDARARGRALPDGDALDLLATQTGLARGELLRMLATPHLVAGLGHGALGAPLLLPVDARQRLDAGAASTARAWIPEGAVSAIGRGALVIQAAEGQGGIALAGRTLPVWNRYRVTKDFPENQPWLLRRLDVVRFHAVGAREFAETRESFLLGRHSLRVEQASIGARC